MLRAFLEEDLRLIQKYFPGAETVALRTPFDLTTQPRRARTRQVFDSFRDDQEPGQGLRGEIAWTN
jgi:hypothetical protein